MEKEMEKMEKIMEKMKKVMEKMKKMEKVMEKVTEKVMEKIWILTAQESKVKTVEEFIDCLLRLTKSLSGKSPKFFEEVKADIRVRILENATGLIEKSAGPRPSLSSKARFGLMDLRDILK